MTLFHHKGAQWHLGVVAYVFNPSTGGRSRWISEFEAILVYRVSSRTARLHRETLSQKSKTKQRGTVSVVLHTLNPTTQTEVGRYNYSSGHTASHSIEICLIGFQKLFTLMNHNPELTVVSSYYFRGFFLTLKKYVCNVMSIFKHTQPL